VTTQWRLSGGPGRRPAAPVCRLEVPYTSEHTYQVIGGLVLLARAGVIALDLALVPRRDGLGSPHLLTALLDGEIRVTYDMHDGYNLEPSAFAGELDHSDLYFKRSFDARRHAGLPGAERIHPYGLNYGVTTRHPIFRRLEWAAAERSARAIAKWALGRDRLAVEDFEEPPGPPRGEPRVVFITRAWDPGERSPPEAEARESMNALRAGCVRALRSELGPRAVAGLAPTAYALERYPDCVSKTWLPRRSSIRQLREADVGVATAGLFGSNGWTLAESVAAARGIVTEKLAYETTGGFASGDNYLEFASPDECVERTVELLENPERLSLMKAANHAHYQAYVRPDQLVLNTLRIALGGAV
jgi:hypothetical protein